jgi:hypothetical protein
MPIQQLTDPLAALDAKLALVSDRVRAVVGGYQTGLYLCGAAGLGKSYSVLTLLESQEANYRVFNSRMTAKGLFRALEKAPDAVHVLEDMERVTSDRDAQGVLRSALWAQPGKDRVVTWVTSEAEARFAFSGGIIMLANRPLTDMPELRALATRIAVHKLEITDEEMAANIRRIAGNGFARGKHNLTSEQSIEICDYVVSECRIAHCPLDLRLLDNACLDYLQWETNQTNCHWRDLVANRIRQSVLHFRHEIERMSREDRLELERKIVRQICDETEDTEKRVKKWQKETGKSQATFYRRKAELESGEFA